MERIKRKYTRKKKIEEDLCWQVKEQVDMSDTIFDVYTKNVLWVNNGKQYSPYFYTLDENNKKMAVIPYAQIDLVKFIKEGIVSVNNDLNILN
jgi:hypothetical protein